MTDLPLEGLTIGITAERRADEQVRLFNARGAATLHGATIRIWSRRDDAGLKAATEAVIRRPPDYLLASTGFGMRTWLAAADDWGLRAGILEALSHARILNRGQKAASANTGAGLREWWRAPNERFEEAVEKLLAEPLDGAHVAVQLHGIGAPKSIARFEAAGAVVTSIDAYGESLPVDPEPAYGLIDAACDRRLAAVTFTTAPAVHNLFVLADRRGRADELRDALNGPVVAACVGPVCAEGALDEGVLAPLVPDRSRLVPLVQALTERLAADPQRTPP
ncbi:MAG: uroporphyrinogen-III synthase [Actinomycetota bacterium]|nr:uroporphyrinogen-III synthase [Actinomycetota bacterium]